MSDFLTVGCSHLVECNPLCLISYEMLFRHVSCIDNKMHIGVWYIAAHASLVTRFAGTFGSIRWGIRKCELPKCARQQSSSVADVGADIGFAVKR